MKNAIVFAIFAAACAGVHAEVYRWVDAQGKVHYSDEPPPASIKQVEIKKKSGGKPAEANLPYVLQQAIKNFPVTLYSSPCGEGCKRASALLARRGIPYTEIDATDPATHDEIKAITGGEVEVPLLKVGNDSLRGFQEEKWNKSLDAAGYPQTAVSPARPPARPAKPAPPPAETSQ